MRKKTRDSDIIIQLTLQLEKVGGGSELGRSSDVWWQEKKRCAALERSIEALNMSIESAREDAEPCGSQVQDLVQCRS
eukprot:767547-Hanusia_phi.AAC.3